MKTFALILLATLLLTTTEAFAASTCLIGESTAEMADLKGIRLVERLDVVNLKRPLTPDELRMIQIAVADSGYDVSVREALAIFRDEPSYSNAGAIKRYALKTERGTLQLIAVTYYPGENEYGSIFAVLNKRIAKVAKVNDGDFYGCTLKTQR